MARLAVPSQSGNGKRDILLNALLITAAITALLFGLDLIYEHAGSRFYSPFIPKHDLPLALRKSGGFLPSTDVLDAQSPTLGETAPRSDAVDPAVQPEVVPPSDAPAPTQLSLKPVAWDVPTLWDMLLCPTSNASVDWTRPLPGCTRN